MHNASAFIPFSFGPVSCPGKNVVLLEIRAVICFIVQRFNISIKDGFELEKWEDGIEDWFVTMLPSLLVVLDTRNKS